MKNNKLFYFKKQTGEKWDSWKSEDECTEEEKDQANLRQIKEDEVILDIEDKLKVNGILVKLKADGFKINGGNWDTGSRGNHIKLNFSELRDYGEEVRNKIRRFLIKRYGCDESKASETLIAKENKPHFKTGKLKTLISKEGGENKIPKWLWKELEKLNEFQKSEEIIQKIDKEEIKNDHLINYIFGNKIKEGNRNNVLLKNIAIMLVNAGYDDTFIKSLGNEIIKNLPGKNINELMGWIKKAKNNQIKEINYCELNRFIQQHNLPIGLYKIQNNTEGIKELKVCYNSGRLNNNLYFDTIFKQENDKYYPLVILNNGESLKVYHNKEELFKLEGKEISDIEDYDYFIYNKTKYKFYSKLFFNDRLGINIPNNDVVKMINDKIIISDKSIYDELINKRKEYWDHSEHYNYDLENANVIQSYLKRKINKIFYKVYQGKENTGKSTIQKFNSLTKYRGKFSGKGTVALNARLLNFLEVSLEQDEFDKMSREENQQFLGILNNGLYPDGSYSFVNTNKKDPADQIVCLNVYGDKSFSTNDLSNFDRSFLSRCDITIATRQLRKLKDIYQLTEEEIQSFQNIRNRLFVYCLSNAKQVKADIDYIKSELEQEGSFGRKTDIYSLILGIIKHFKGDYYKQVEEYLKSKDNIQNAEDSSITKDSLVLEFLTDNFVKGLDSIDIFNKEMTNFVNDKLGLSNSDNKISSRTIGKILRDYGLIKREQDIIRTNQGYKYTIHKTILNDILSRFNYKELKEKIPLDQNPSSFSSSSTLSSPKSEHSEGNELSELRQSIINKKTELTFSKILSSEKSCFGCKTIKMCKWEGTDLHWYCGNCKTDLYTNEEKVTNE